MYCSLHALRIGDSNAVYNFFWRKNFLDTVSKKISHNENKIIFNIICALTATQTSANKTVNDKDFMMNSKIQMNPIDLRCILIYFFLIKKKHSYLVSIEKKSISSWQQFDWIQWKIRPSIKTQPLINKSTIWRVFESYQINLCLKFNETLSSFFDTHVIVRHQDS